MTVASRFPKRRDAPEGYMEWIRAKGCQVPGCYVNDREWITYNAPWPKRGVMPEVAHVVSRGAGGNDYGNVTCLCRYHHRQQHRVGIKTFQRTYDIDLGQSALDFQAEWEAESPPK